MYEMYPEAWAERCESPGRPRRRPRKEHSVLPLVITLHIESLHIESLRAAPQH